MGRWNPDARGRLEQAAFELFRERGYDQTTVADLATRAGLTERTFFRHFADKREVLFGGAASLQDVVMKALDELPHSVSAFDAVRAAIEAIAGFMHGRRELARERRKIIHAHVDLRERELIKRASLTTALAAALEARGVARPAANLAADMGIGVFYVAFARWIDEPVAREFLEVVREDFERVRILTA